MLLNEKETDSFGAERNLHYICGANGLAAIYVTTADKDTMYYAYTDYQHNLLALTDAAGKPYERYSYDPWGNRRSATDWTVSDTLQSHIVDRGYTLHEHLGEFGLINMNGRMYDPKLACFLSPDPYIQSPETWLNHNRYAYCLGNPLKYTDPSGKRYDDEYEKEHTFSKSYEIREDKFYMRRDFTYETSDASNGIGYGQELKYVGSCNSDLWMFDNSDLTKTLSQFQGGMENSYDVGGYGAQSGGNSLQNFWNTSSVVNDGALAIAMGYNGMNNDIKRKAAYNISKKVPVKSGTLFQTAKSVGKGTAKVLGKTSNVISLLSVGSDIVRQEANTSTLVDIGMLVGGAAATFVFGASAAPVVVGVGLVYGVGCMFGLDDYIDSQVDMSGVLNPFR